MSLKHDESAPIPVSPAFLVRGGFGGILMGLANLVPGISGGTMLLAAGVYPQFIHGVAEVSTLRFRLRSILLLGAVAMGALGAIISLAGPVKDLVVHHRWIMYAIFIGLTLGGVPIIWRLIDRRTTGMWLGGVFGFAGMAVLAIAQAQGDGSADREGAVVMFLAGVAGASAMILPGVSGGYLLLVLGVYVPLLAAIDSFKSALPGVGAWDSAIVTSVGLNVMLPVALGVLVGIAGVSNLLKWCLHRFECPTLGVLLGLLLGAVVGLWPFQQPVGELDIGTEVKGQTVTAENRADFAIDDYPTEVFAPTAGQVGGALGLILAGFACSTGVALVGGTNGKAEESAARG
jgi:putative membrane protein